MSVSSLVGQCSRGGLGPLLQARKALHPRSPLLPAPDQHPAPAPAPTAPSAALRRLAAAKSTMHLP